MPPGTTPSGQELSLSGNNTGYTGNLTVDGGHNVRFTTTSSTFSGGGMLTVSSTATALGGVILGNATLSAPTIVDATGGNGGVLGIGNGITYSTALDFSNLGTGYPQNFFLGTDAGGGTYSAATLGPGTGNTYRLGRRRQRLTIASGLSLPTLARPPVPSSAAPRSTAAEPSSSSPTKPTRAARPSTAAHSRLAMAAPADRSLAIQRSAERAPRSPSTVRRL